MVQRHHLPLFVTFEGCCQNAPILKHASGTILSVEKSVSECVLSACVMHVWLTATELNSSHAMSAIVTGLAHVECLSCLKAIAQFSWVIRLHMLSIPLFWYLS